YTAVLAQWPQAEAVHLSLGHALKTVGRREEAVAAYRAAYGVRGDFGDAYWSLANLKTYRFTEAEMAALAHWQGAPRVAEVDRIHLHFAYAKGLEDAGDHAGAFAQYAAGNALKAARSGYTADGFDAEVERMIAATPAALFAGASGGAPDPDPIFIVGLPRAGSTLVEQILASHSQIEGTAELPNILAQAHALSARDMREAASHYPASLSRIAPEDFTEMGRRFMAETRHLRSGKPFFIDKMPNNFRHIGLIARMLPKARIIDARREPMACCFSGFKQLFAEGQEFSYSLEGIGRYYRGYLRLMEHWQAVLPGRILTVQHEDVLEDLEGQLRRLLAFLDLPFEEGCIRFHETKRAVRTASSEQVRRPIDRSGADQWRHFEPFLGPLRAALGDAVAHQPA
ncbi:MAG TPA: sulfotransferase, partial [Novosphingobium sp.]|nr:sulfotransferase [Novosphingobium sp.]